MFGLNHLETYLVVALVLVVLVCSLILSGMTEAHMVRRDQKRMARHADRARVRRAAGKSVRPPR